MTTEAQQAQQAAFEIENAGSVERALGRLEGQNQILLQIVQEQGRQSREDYRALDAKIDLTKSDLDTNIAALHSEVNRLLYWVLGVAGVIIATIIGAAFSVILLS